MAVSGKAMEQSMNTEKNKDIEFFSVSRTRLAILSILTFRLYEAYWFYRNWKAIKDVEQSEISPIGRAIFGIFYCSNLAKKVLESAQLHGYAKSYIPKNVAIIYFLLFILSSLLFKGIFMALIPTFIPLFSIQRAIEYNNSKIVPSNNQKKKFAKGELIIIIVGVALFCLGIFETYTLLKESYRTYFPQTVEQKNVEWKEFVSPEGDFKMNFPVEPNHELENIQVPGTNFTIKRDYYSNAISNDEKLLTFYEVNILTLPKQFADEYNSQGPEAEFKLLQVFVDKLLISDEKEPKAELIFSTSTTFGKVQAVDFLIQRKDETLLKGRSFRVESKVYSLMVDYEKDNYNETEYSKFINSFTLLK